MAKMQKRLRALLELAVMAINLACALFVIAQGLTFFSNVYSKYSELGAGSTGYRNIDDCTANEIFLSILIIWLDKFMIHVRSTKL